MSETLYRKVGRRYVPVFSMEQYGQDIMKLGTWRMTYAYAEGARRYSYDVRPDTASFDAAAMLAEQAMRDAMNAAAIATPSAPSRPYTKRQRELVDRFTAEMVAAGAFMPQWWTHQTSDVIARAGTEAVRNWKG